MQDDKIEEYLKVNMSSYLPLRDIVFNTLIYNGLSITIFNTVLKSK